MTDNLDRLDVLAAAATPGPWIAYLSSPHVVDMPSKQFAVIHGDEGREVNAKTAAYIAACDPATIRSLVAAVRERDELRAALDRLDGRVGILTKGQIIEAISAIVRRDPAALHREDGA